MAFINRCDMCGGICATHRLLCHRCKAKMDDCMEMSFRAVDVQVDVQEKEVLVSGLNLNKE